MELNTHKYTWIKLPQKDGVTTPTKILSKNLEKYKQKHPNLEIME